MGHLKMLERNAMLRKTVMQLGNDAALIDVTAATDWFFQESNQEYWDISRDMHRLTAPAEKTWMEYTIPAYTSTPAGRMDLPKSFDSIGASILCVPLDPEERAYDGWFAEDFMTRYLIGGALGEKLFALYKEPEWIEMREESALYFKENPPRFLLGGAVFIQQGNGITDLRTVFAMYLDENGMCYPAPHHRTSFIVWSPLMMLQMMNGEIDPQSAASMQVAGLLPFMFALSLMNCKNVTIETETRKLQRHERRQLERKGETQIEYKWLTVRQLQRRVDKDAAQQGGEHSKRKLHFVRGNWATYDDKPLFGKYRGTFFRPQSWRGDMTQGAVVKGYNLIGDTDGPGKTAGPGQDREVRGRRRQTG
jgi:hypothetical protein